MVNKLISIEELFLIDLLLDDETEEGSLTWQSIPECVCQDIHALENKLPDIYQRITSRINQATESKYGGKFYETKTISVDFERQKVASEESSVDEGA